MIPFITSRSSTWRLLPPRLAGGINGSISAHSSSVRSLGYRNALRSYRPRFFDVHIGDPPRIRPPLLNHKQLTGFNMFSDRHSEAAKINRRPGRVYYRSYGRFRVVGTVLAQPKKSAADNGRTC